MRSWHAINLLIILALFLESVGVRPLSTDGAVSSVEAKRRAGMGACVRHEHDDAFLSLLVSLASPTGVRSSVRSPLVGKKAVNQLQSLTELTARPTTVVSVPRVSSSFCLSAVRPLPRTIYSQGKTQRASNICLTPSSPLSPSKYHQILILSFRFFGHCIPWGRTRIIRAHLWPHHSSTVLLVEEIFCGHTLGEGEGKQSIWTPNIKFTLTYVLLLQLQLCQRRVQVCVPDVALRFVIKA